MHRRQFLGAGAMLSLAPITKSFAGAWPDRPVTMIVPSSPGGSTDITARVLAQKLGAELGQTVVVDNRPGANGAIGLMQIARAQPDGYTIGVSTNTYLTFNPSLYPSLQYDSLRDFTPVALATFIPNVLVVRADLPAQDIASLVDYMRSRKKALDYSSAGYGSSAHLAAELFRQQTGVDMLHVPYKGGAPAMADLLAGQVQLSFPPLPEAYPYLQDGRIRALGMTTRERSPLLPDVPSISEVLPGYELVLWNGIIGPAGLPADVAGKLAAAVQATVRDGEVKSKLMEQGSLIPDSYGTPEAFSAFLKAEMANAQKLVASAGPRKDDAGKP